MKATGQRKSQITQGLRISRGIFSPIRQDVAGGKGEGGGDCTASFMMFSVHRVISRRKIETESWVRHVANIRKVTNRNNMQWENLNGTDNFGYLDVRGRMILY
jgi:hypothetical protein